VVRLHQSVVVIHTATYLGYLHPVRSLNWTTAKLLISLAATRTASQLQRAETCTCGGLMLMASLSAMSPRLSYQLHSVLSTPGMLRVLLAGGITLDF
jgi:hypothetical protein